MATRAQQGPEPFANGAGRAGEEDSHAMTLTRPMVLVLVAGLTQPLVAQQRHTITHEDVFLMKRLSSPALSPDGRWVVFSVTEPSYTEGDQVTDLWLVPADGSAEPRRLTNTKGGESGVDWSPRNRGLPFRARGEGERARATTRRGAPCSACPTAGRRSASPICRPARAIPRGGPTAAPSCS